MEERSETMYDIYIRISRLGDRTADEATEVYEAQCRDWANRNGISIDQVEEDTDVSGSVAVAERKLERLIQKVEAGESEGILTPYLDRFGRDIISGSVALKRIADVGGRLVCVNDGFDSSSPGSKEIFGYRMVTAEAFLDRVRANYQVAIDRKVAAGSYVYKAPFGYRKDEVGRLTVNEQEARLVRDVFERRAAGDDIGKLTRFLREQGAISVYSGKPLTKSGVRTMVANRAYVGEVSIQNGTKGKPRVITDFHAPIIPRQIFEAANAVRGAYFPQNGKLASQVKLPGLVYCATCKRRLRISGYKAGGQSVANYACTYADCPAHASMKASKLDAYVEGLLMTAVVDREPHVGAVIEGDTRYQDAMTAVHEAERVYEEFRDSVELQRELGIRGFADGLRVRKEALELARRELAKARPAKGNGRRGRKGRMMTYEAFLHEYERESNARLIDRVVLKPNPGGPGGKKRGPETRVDVYFAGSDEPYRPTYAKLSKKDEESLRQHAESLRQSRTAHTG
jgi:DNA invertase Pin-like site-specific DNA recombinase